MTVGSIISGIIALLKVIPVIDGWFQQLMVAYTQARIESMKRENREAIRKAILEHDQRDAEKVIGNPEPGEPSGNKGSEIVNEKPPGVAD